MWLVLLAACGARQPAHPKPTDGAIAGLVRDETSGDPVGAAEIRIAKRSTTSTGDGLYSIDHLPPGRFDLYATFAGQPVTVHNVVIEAGLATYVDIRFMLGTREPIELDYSDSAQGEIKRYRPKAIAPNVSIIEGTVTELGTRERLSGAVVTAVDAATQVTLQTVTDDHGRYQFEPVTPGVYTVSAYYSIGGRGQIEVRRSDIHVDAAERVEIPIWVETTKR
jgi:hypothetical protein